MSFSNTAKMEIVSNKPLRTRFKKAHAYGLLLFARSFSQGEISIHTESADVAELYTWLVHSLGGRDIQVQTLERPRKLGPLLTVSLPRQRDRDKLLAVLGHGGEEINSAILSSPGHVHSFLAGAWLACGNITDPQKGYHLEFVCKNSAFCPQLRLLLDGCTGGVGHTTRRGAEVLYLKEVAEIEDLLTLMGASKASLAMIEVEIIKNIRNKANRATNCETANIDKTVRASAEQVADIQLILNRKGFDWLPDNLRSVARLRMENPELSLRELAEISPGGISRSGIHHRLDKLSKLAATLKTDGEGDGDA